MSRSLNKVTLLGHLGADPEIKYMPNGNAVVNFTMATSEQWKDKDTGDLKENTEWHRVVFFGKLAEVIGEYQKKGSQVYIEGSLRTRKWEDKEGVERYTTEIVGRELIMLGGKGEGESRPKANTDRRPAPAGAKGKSTSRPQEADEPFDDDIPF